MCQTFASKKWMHKYISITFFGIVTVFAAGKIILLKFSFSYDISGVIFPELSESTAVFLWLPFNFFTFHLCSPVHVSRLSLRAFPYSEHHHILNIKVVYCYCFLINLFNLWHAATGKQTQGSCLLVFVVGQLKSWTIFKTSALNDPLHQV